MKLTCTSKMRKILCIIMAFIICSFCLTPFVKAEELTDLQTQQEELQNQINEANGELDEVQNELTQNLQQIQKLDEKIETSQKELDELNTKIAKLQVQVEEISKNLKVAEENYNNQKELLDERLVIIYESGDTNYLDVMLTSRSVSDFLSNYFLITELANYETELLDDMASKKKEIEITKEKLDTENKKLSEMKKNQTVTAKILENTKTMRQNYVTKLSDKEKEIQDQIDEYNNRFAEINAEILSLATQGLDTKYIGGTLEWPVPGYTRITSKYGMRTHPITGVYKLHSGVDIGAPTGANFVAANDGIVVKAGYNSAYGNMVIIDHGGGVSTLYAHGSEILVQVGDIVKRGETAVLKVGSTGYSTGPHAHFEVRLNGVVTDPLPYITNGIVPDATSTQEENETSENTTNAE